MKIQRQHELHEIGDEYEEIYRSTYLEKFINYLKLLDTKNHSNRSNIKCVLPNQAVRSKTSWVGTAYSRQSEDCYFTN